MVLVVLFFILSFFAIAGTYLNINPYDNLIWIKAIVHFMFLTFTMMIIPFCYKKFSGKATVKNGRRVCKWNCLIVLSLYFVIDIFLMGGIYDETFQNLGANLVYTLMFYYINLKLFFNKNKVTEETIPCESEKEHIENTQKTPELDIDKMSPQEAAEYLVAEQSGEKYIPKEKQFKKIKTKFCSQCGSQIDPVTKKCTGCDKQYFKGFRFNKLSITVSALAVVIATVSILCVLQYVNTQKLKDEISYLERQVSTKQSTINRLENEIDDLESDLWDYKDIASLVDNHVVFVENDGSDLYHKYDCYRFKGDSFWVYNTEKAVQFDFSPCPNCH